MRVLMFGWEFPPYKSGGLGTACYGMGRALAKKGTEILFVLPQTPLDAPVRVGERLSLCSASGTRVERTARNLRINEEVRELWREKLHIEHVDSLLLPYDTPESYDERRRELERLQSVKRNADVFSSTQETILRLHGGYGPDLMSEVYRYACAAVAHCPEGTFRRHPRPRLDDLSGGHPCPQADGKAAGGAYPTRWSTTGAATI